MSDFTHRLALDQIRDGDRVDLVADEAERAAIARRLGLPAVERLEAHCMLAREGDLIRATGRLKAIVEQACVASGVPVRESVDEAIELRFAPEPNEIAPGDEMELADEELDTVFHDGAGIELGTAIADSLALAVDPYPRSANADAALREAGVISEEQAGPFAALAALKGKMGGV